MTNLATVTHAPWGPRLREASVALPILVLLGVVLWLALNERPVGSEAGPAPPPGGQVPRSVSVHEAEPLFLVVIGHQQAAIVREQLIVEASLRRSIGETPRVAEVIQVRDEDQARAVLEAIRADARGLSVSLGAMIVVPEGDEPDERAAGVRPPSR